MEMMYIKKGRKYIPIQPFEGFPADGIWLVRKGGKSSVLVTYLDGLHNQDMRIVTQLSKNYDELVTLLIDRNQHSASDLARLVIDILSKLSEGKEQE